jgi:hypothetical protein
MKEFSSNWLKTLKLEKRGCILTVRDRGILFLLIFTSFFFSGDEPDIERAAKAAGNELRAISAFFRTSLFVPFFCPSFPHELFLFFFFFFFIRSLQVNLKVPLMALINLNGTSPVDLSFFFSMRSKLKKPPS